MWRQHADDRVLTPRAAGGTLADQLPPCHQLIFDPRTNGTDVGAVRDDVLLDRGSENDVTEEMDFEGTSADGRGRSAPRPLTARDTARARKQVGG